MIPARDDGLPPVRPRLILADDHRVLADALAAALARDHEIVGVVSDGAALLQLLRRRVGDCLLLDLQMPGRNGLALLPDVRRLQPELRILVLTMFVDRALADVALRAGAHGFIPKEAPLGHLTAAIGEVVAGGRYESPLIPKCSHRVGIEAQHPGLACLTPRQQQIVLLMGDGISSSDISRRLGVSASTITFHKQNLKRSLGIDTESDLVRYAVLLRAGVQAGSR